MLRLGTKYQIDSLRKDAVKRLQEYFPYGLQGEDSDIFMRISAGVDSIRIPCGCVGLQPSDAIAVVNLARECDLPRLLPPALYVCAQLDYRTLVHGDAGSGKILQKLSPDDLERCLKGQAMLRGVVAKQLMLLFQAKPVSYCSDKGCCKHALEETKEFLTGELSLDCNPLRHSGGINVSIPGLCPDCEDQIFFDLDIPRGRVWDNLAQYFDLEDPMWPYLPGPYLDHSYP